MGNMTLEALPTREQTPISAGPSPKMNMANAAQVNLAKALLPRSEDAAAKLAGQILTDLDLR